MSQYKFNVIQGWTTLAVLDGQALPPLTGSGRVRANIPRVLQALLTVLAQAESMAMIVLNEKPSGDWGTFIQGMTIGQRYKAMAKLARDKPDTNGYVDAYLATMAVARWMPDNVTNPRSSDPELILPSTPSLPTGDIVPAAMTAALAVTVVGVAASACAALAWWAGKREDAQASIAVDSLRAMAAADIGQKLAMKAITEGKPIPPEVGQLFADLGKKGEVSRWWVAPTVGIGVGGVAGVGTFLAARRASKGASAS